MTTPYLLRRMEHIFHFNQGKRNYTPIKHLKGVRVRTWDRTGGAWVGMVPHHCDSRELNADLHDTRPPLYRPAQVGNSNRHPSVMAAVISQRETFIFRPYSSLHYFTCLRSQFNYFHFSLYQSLLHIFVQISLLLRLGGQINVYKICWEQIIVNAQFLSPVVFDKEKVFLASSHFASTL